MKTIKVVTSNERLITPSGLALAVLLEKPESVKLISRVITNRFYLLGY